MTDVHTSAIRSKNMQAIKSRDTKPELLVRRMLHARGFRFRVNVKTLPAKPDIVFPKYQAIVLVNGCFGTGTIAMYSGGQRPERISGRKKSQVIRNEMKETSGFCNLMAGRC